MGIIGGVIIRIVHGHGIADRADTAGGHPAARSATDDERMRLVRAAARVTGLETLIVGWHGIGDAAPGSALSPSVVVTAWRDVDSMVAATSRDETSFLRQRLGLDVDIERAESYEVMSRTFGSLPTPRSILRVVAMGARASAEAALFEHLRDIQHRLTERGLIASHVARRVAPDGIEAIVVGVWSDHSAIEAATGGRIDRPAFADELAPWVESTTIDTYEALELAPRLPMTSGPPILILDGSRRVVDLTPAAAATVARTQEEAVGMLIEELAASDDADATATWLRLLDDDETGDRAGRSAWAVPSGGSVIVHWRLRRDVPVRGRHTILVRRRREPEPTSDELDAALAEAFPLVPSSTEA
jgi:PAS domain-containing protein